MSRSLVPWRERFPVSLAHFEHEMEDLMERFFGKGVEEWGRIRFNPSLNVSETDGEYAVTVELPGLKPEDVTVEMKDGHLVIHGEKKEETEEKGKTFHRVERSHGEFRRVVRLPGAVAEDKVEAKVGDGLLTVRIPKAVENGTKKIPVQS